MTEEYVIDLDKKRAERLAKNGKGPTVRFGGKKWVLPPELPFAVVLKASELQKNPESEGLFGFLEELVGPEHYEKFLAAKPTLGDLQEFVEAVMEAYGMVEDEDADAS